jgi:transcriptional regulator with XRE-family HTH domain
MEAQGISRAEFARRLGTSQAYVTRVLGGNANFTLKTMSKLALALDLELEVVLRPRSDTAALDADRRERAQ